VIADSLAVFECANAAQVPAGDHVIFLGRIERSRHRPGRPLVFFASRYGLPESAIEAAAETGACAG